MKTMKRKLKRKNNGIPTKFVECWTNIHNNSFNVN